MTFIDKFKNSESITLNKFEGEGLSQVNLDHATKLSASPENIRISFIDLETTGTDVSRDEVIEIAIKVISINKNDGSSLAAINSYQSLSQPELPITEQISKINGITNEMVEGKSIDWNEVDSIISNSHLVVAHNSYFDRPFLEKYLNKHIPWACSLNDIDWFERGFINSKLELLCIWHGFYYDAHRAMNDVDSLINLVTHESYVNNMPIVELIKNARMPYFKAILSFGYNASFVELVKGIGSFRFDSTTKNWWKIYKSEEEANKELSQLPPGIDVNLNKITSFHKFK
jgi:DNA polymerase III subunit epsilon